MKLQTKYVPVHVLIFFHELSVKEKSFIQTKYTVKAKCFSRHNANNEKCLPKHFQTFSDTLVVPSAAALNSHFLFFKKTRFNLTLSHKCGQSIVFFLVCCTPALKTQKIKIFTNKDFANGSYVFSSVKNAKELQFFLNRVLRKVLIFLTSDWNIKLVKWLGVFFCNKFCSVSIGREKYKSKGAFFQMHRHKHTNHKYTHTEQEGPIPKIENNSNFEYTKKWDGSKRPSCAMALYWTGNRCYDFSLELVHYFICI